MCNKRIKLMVGAVVALYSVVGVVTADFEVSWWTIDGGGEMWSLGDDLELSGTIGQPDADPAMTGGDFALTGGFWLTVAIEPAYTLGDLNCDGSLNSLDIDPFVLVLTSTPPDYPEYYTQHPDCHINLADCNSDGSVNSLDIDPFVDLLTAVRRV